MLDSGKIADMTGISDRTIRDWRKKGIIPDSDDESTVVQAILRHLENKIEKARKPSGTDELYREKVRLTQAQSDKIRLEIAEREAELVNARESAMVWSNYIQACKKRLLAIPTKLAPRLVNITKAEEVKELLGSVIDETLTELGSEAFVRSSHPDSETSSDAIASPIPL